MITLTLVLTDDKNCSVCCIHDFMATNVSANVTQCSTHGNTTDWSAYS